MPANTKDHVVPLSILATIEGLADDVRDEILRKMPPLITVYSCRSCNSTLGARMFRTIGARKTFIKEHMREKYARVLRQPDWSEDEMGELGHTLGALVRQKQELKKIILARLKW